MRIQDIRLAYKSGGKSGEIILEEQHPATEEGK
jgi:hypothetical protein